MIRRWIIRITLLALLALVAAGWASSRRHFLYARFAPRLVCIQCGSQWGLLYLYVRWPGGDGPSGFALGPFQASMGPVADSPFWPETGWTPHPAPTIRTAMPSVWGPHHGFALYRDPVPGQWLNLLTVPYWFLTPVAALLVVFVWRRPRPRIDPRTAFPVEVRGTHA